MYGQTGQPLDHEPTMGQVPIVPPGTPPNEQWGLPTHHPAHFNGMPPHSAHHPFMGRRSPNMSQPQMMPNDSMAAMMVGGPPPPPPRGMPPMGHDINDNESNYPDYSHNGPHSHVEVYWRDTSNWIDMCVWLSNAMIWKIECVQKSKRIMDYLLWWLVLCKPGWEVKYCTHMKLLQRSRTYTFHFRCHISCAKQDSPTLSLIITLCLKWKTLNI